MTRPSVLEAHFPEIEELCEQVRLWDLDLRPLGLLKKPSSGGRIVQARLRGLDYGHCRLDAAFDQHGAAPPGGVTFVVKDASVGRLWWRGQDTAEDDVLVYSRGSEVRCMSGVSFAIDTVTLNEDRIEDLCQSLQLHLPPPRKRPETFRVHPDRLAQIRHDLRVFRNSPESRSFYGLHGVVEALLHAWLSPMQARRSKGKPLRSRERAIGACLDLLEATDLASTTTEDLRRVSNVSERTLEYAFRERFGTTPAQFLKSRRLGQARNDILHARETKRSIVDIATTLGFWHHGHFCADYRRAFGETPSQTRAVQ